MIRLRLPTLLGLFVTTLSGGCDGEIKGNRNAGAEQTKPEATEEEVQQPPTEATEQAGSETQSAKLTSDNCKDPKSSQLLKDVQIMTCDGKFLTGDYTPPAPQDLSLLLPENIKSGITIAGVAGEYVASPEEPSPYVPTTGEPDVASITKLSVDAPLLALVLDEDDCRSRLMDSFSVTSRPARVALIDGKLEFFVTCKAKSYNSWSTARASWLPGQAAVWLDQDSETPATFDPLLTRYSHHSGDSDLGHGNSVTMLQKADSSLIGIFETSGGGLGSGRYRITANSLTDLGPLSIAPDSQNWFEAPDANNFMSYGNSKSYALTESNNKTYLFYDASHYKSAIGFVEINDFAAFTNDNETELFKNYRHPFVANANNKIYMVAYDTIDAVWKAKVGTAEGLADDRPAIDLKLRDLFLAEDKWDSTKHAFNRVNDEPMVFGISVLNHQLYVFYIAGNVETWPTDYDSESPENIGERGIGVIKISLLP